MNNILNTNTRSFAGEEWKKIHLGEEFTNSDSRLEISSWGRIRTFNKVNSGKLINGSMINGYRILRHRMFKARDADTEKKLEFLKAPVLATEKNIVAVKKSLRNKNISKEEQVLLTKQLDAEILILAENKKIYNAFYKKDYIKRTVYINHLIHRLVAEYFLPKPSAEQKVVAHLDHDKLNNNVSNLRWMTAIENSKHQQTSPSVISERKVRKEHIHYYAANFKLTVTKVMFLKKLLNEGKTIKSLAKQFKVSETQILNIKKEKNWGSVEAAK